MQEGADRSRKERETKQTWMQFRRELNKLKADNFTLKRQVGKLQKRVKKLAWEVHRPNVGSASCGRLDYSPKSCYSGVLATHASSTPANGLSLRTEQPKILVPSQHQHNLRSQKKVDAGRASAELLCIAAEDPGLPLHARSGKS